MTCHRRFLTLTNSQPQLCFSWDDCLVGTSPTSHSDSSGLQYGAIRVSLELASSRQRKWVALFLGKNSGWCQLSLLGNQSVCLSVASSIIALHESAFFCRRSRVCNDTSGHGGDDWTYSTWWFAKLSTRPDWPERKKFDCAGRLFLVDMTQTAVFAS
jgi:hypothetical protein